MRVFDTDDFKATDADGNEHMYRDGTGKGVFGSHRGLIYEVSWAPDDTELLTASADGVVCF